MRALLLCTGRQPALSPLPCYGMGGTLAAEATVKSTGKRGEKILAFRYWDALILLHQRRSYRAAVVRWCLGTSSCPSRLGRSMRKPVSTCVASERFPSKGSLSRRGMMAVPCFPYGKARHSTGLPPDF